MPAVVYEAMILKVIISVVRGGFIV